MTSTDDQARLEAAGLDPDDVAARFTEWATEEGIFPDVTRERCADMARAFGAGYAARHVEPPDSFGAPGTGRPVGIASEIDSDTLAAFLARVPSIHADTVGRALVNIGRYLPPGVRVRLRATYRATDETLARGRIEVPRG